MKKRILVGIVGLISCGIQADSLHDYFWANYQQFAGNKEESRKWYNHIFSDENHSLLSNKGYIHFLADTQEYKKIIELMQKVGKTFEQDPDIQLIFVNALRNAGRKDDADNRIVELSRTFKNHTEIVFNAAEALVQRKEHKNAITLLDSYLDSAPRRANNFIFYFLKAQTYMQLKQLSNARECIQQCLEAHPRFPQGWLLKAMLEEQAGQLDQAIKGFSSYLEISGPNKQIEQHLVGLVLKQKSMQKPSNSVVLHRPCFEQALALFEQKQYRAALGQITSCLSENETNPQMRLLKVQILTALQEYTDAIKDLVAWSSSEPTNLMWPQVLHLLSRTQAPIEKVINAFTTLQKQQPNNVAFNLYLADLHTRSGNDAQAITYHKKALPLTSDARIKTRILFQIASMQYEKRMYSHMLQTLSELEKIQPNFAPALNLQAYYQATEGHDLTKAEQLFDRAYELDKGNPHILDTKGVILYKQKKYDQALTLFEPLADKLPKDGSVHIHLAKTYAKLGNMKDAQKQIDHAQKTARTPYEQKTSQSLQQRWKQNA